MTGGHGTCVVRCRQKLEHSMHIFQC